MTYNYRAKIGKSTTEMLSKFGCLDGMSQSNQIKFIWLKLRSRQGIKIFINIFMPYNIVNLKYYFCRIMQKNVEFYFYLFYNNIKFIKRGDYK